MKVSIAYAAAQIWNTLEVNEGATVEDVIQQSGLLDGHDINLKKQKVGVFGKFIKLNAPVQEGDRVEIYNPITRVLDEDDEEDEDD